MTEQDRKFVLEEYSGEPCGLGNFPSKVFRIKDLNVPMNIALTVDKQTLLLMDSVDYYQTVSMNKTNAEVLVHKLQCLVGEMENKDE